MAEDRSTTALKETLDHIHALGIASRDEIGSGTDELLRTGLIEPVNFKLSEMGEKARKLLGNRTSRE